MRRVVSMGIMLLAAVLALAGCESESQDNYGIINTPLIISQLTGSWERSGTSGQPFPQSLVLNADGSGSLRLSPSTPPAAITYRVDVFNLIIQYYFDDHVPRNWRTRTLVYRYQITGDTLTLRLIRHGEIETWHKVKT